MKATMKSPIRRVSPSALTQHHAKFTPDGLKFHFGKLHEYTSRTGGGLDKIPLNTLAYEQLHRLQFKELPEVIKNPLDECDPPARLKPVYLCKKALYNGQTNFIFLARRIADCCIYKERRKNDRKAVLHIEGHCRTFARRSVPNHLSRHEPTST
jgi:hypothetical protein